MSKQLDRNINSKNFYKLTDNKWSLEIKKEKLKDILQNKPENVDVFLYNLERSKIWKSNDTIIRTIVDVLYQKEEQIMEKFLLKHKETVFDYFKENFGKKYESKMSNSFFALEIDNTFFIMLSYKTFGKMFIGWRFILPKNVLIDNVKYTIEDVDFIDNITKTKYTIQ